MRWVVAMTVVWLSGSMASSQDRRPPARGMLGPPPASIAPLESSARVQLDRAESLLKNGPADEVLEVFRRVMDTYGDRFIEWPATEKATPAGFSRYGTVRELSWMRLATLRQSAPDVFAAFRRQIDPQARRWFEQAAADRNAALDQRIVDESFLSSFGDDALLRLGDSALERVDYNSARRYWERIAPGLRFVSNNHDQLFRAANRPLWLPFMGTAVAQVWPTVAPLLANSREPTELVYPDTDLSLPEVRARLAIASMMEGNFERARIEIEILQQLAPQAVGTLFGRSGKLVDLLHELMTEAKNWPPMALPNGWSTFGGSSDRNRILPEIAQLSDKPLWSVPLPRWSVEREALSMNGVRVAEDARGLLSYHPLVVGDLAIVQTSPFRDQVQAYRLRTGEAVLPAVAVRPVATDVFDRRTILGVPRFTPTADGTTLFLVDGFTMVSTAEDRQRFSANLAAIDLAAERKLLWEFSPEPPAWPEQISLAGPPVSAGPRLFVTLRRREAVREETHVAALDARDGRLLWRQFIGAAEPAFEAVRTELTHQLLSVDQDTVYCNTNAGLVAALEVRTGRVRWMTGYPRSGLQETDPDRNKLHFYRDLNPCLVHRDVVVVAPTDCNRLFALDATTGIPLWVTPAELAADAVHLLGVAENRLAVSGECIYWFDIRSGRLLGRYPEPFKAAAGFARPSPRGYGRGILAGQHLYWPTRDAILVFDQGTTSRPESDWRPVIVRKIALEEQGVTGGNLVLASETLLIAGAERLVAFDAK